VSSVPPGPEVRVRAERRSPAGNHLNSVRFAAAVIWTVMILVLCWLPADVIKEIEHKSPWFEIPDLDKVIHAGLFVGLAILWRRLAPSRRAIWAVLLGGFALGALSELGQLVPFVNRNAELYDLATDCVGVAIGVAISPLVEPVLRLIERRLIREPLPGEPTAVEQ
jgi:hypothetical protein